MSLSGWKRYKRQLFERSKERAVELKEIKSEIREQTAVVVLKQDYRSDIHQDYGLKTLRLRWHRGSWTIFTESWEPLTEEG
jgi:hypothetical protein